MIQKQIALLVVLIAASLLIVSNLYLGDGADTSNETAMIESTLSPAFDSTSAVTQTNAWALTDIRSQGSSFGVTDSTSASSSATSFGQSEGKSNVANTASFGNSGLTPTSTTATSSIFYSDLLPSEEYGEPEIKGVNEPIESETFSLSLGSTIQSTTANTQNSQSQTQQSSSAQPQIQVVDEIDLDTDVEPETQLRSDIQISGLVISSIGDPVGFMPVTLQLANASDEDTKRFGKNEKSTQTDDNGFYSFGNLVKGSYNVCTTNARGFDRVCQKPRAPLNSADFRLLTTNSGKISGRVVDKNNLALEGVEVNAIPNNSNRATTNANGEFSLQVDVNAQAIYYVYFNKERYARSRVRISGADILVGNNKLTDTVLELISGVQVRGVVRDSSGSLVRGQRIRLSSPTVKSSYSLTGVSDENGQFVIQNVKPAVDYRMSVAVSNDYTYDQSKVGTIEVFTGMPEIQIALGISGKGTIGVKVEDSNGFALANEKFRIFNGSNITGNATTDEFGYMFFGDVSSTQGSSSLRIYNNTDPKYTFWGISLNTGENKTNLRALINEGQLELNIYVKDTEGDALGGVRASLSWVHKGEGITSQTVRSKGKVSDGNKGGLIRFTELGSGTHRLQLTTPDKSLKPYNQEIEINLPEQSVEIKLQSAEES